MLHTQLFWCYIAFGQFVAVLILLGGTAAHCKTGGANFLPGGMYIVVDKIEQKCMIFIWLDLGR